MAAPQGLEFTGLRELNTHLKKVGVPDDAIKTAMNEAGQLVQREAWRIMPVKSGAMARTLKVNKAKNELKVSVGSKSVPYAYTFHARAMGKSKGGFTYIVDRHSRRGSYVKSYARQAFIPDRAFLYQAFERKKQALYEAYVTAIADLLKGA